MGFDSISFLLLFGVLPLPLSLTLLRVGHGERVWPYRARNGSIKRGRLFYMDLAHTELPCGFFPFRLPEHGVGRDKIDISGTYSWGGHMEYSGDSYDAMGRVDGTSSSSTELLVVVCTYFMHVEAGTYLRYPASRK
jgi:hypothetical protein